MGSLSFFVGMKYLKSKIPDGTKGKILQTGENWNSRCKEPKLGELTAVNQLLKFVQESHMFSLQDDESVFLTLRVLMVSRETGIHRFDWSCGVQKTRTSQIIFVNNQDCTVASRNQFLSSSLAFFQSCLFRYQSNYFHQLIPAPLPVLLYPF